VLVAKATPHAILRDMQLVDWFIQLVYVFTDPAWYGPAGLIALGLVFVYAVLEPPGPDDHLRR
jgi:hypothetical protein